MKSTPLPPILISFKVRWKTYKFASYVLQCINLGLCITGRHKWQLAPGHKHHDLKGIFSTWHGRFSQGSPAHRQSNGTLKTKYCGCVIAMIGRNKIIKSLSLKRFHAKSAVRMLTSKRFSDFISERVCHVLFHVICLKRIPSVVRPLRDGRGRLPLICHSNCIEQIELTRWGRKSLGRYEMHAELTVTKVLLEYK